MDDIAGDDGQHHARRSKKGGHEVEQHGAPNDALIIGEAQALGHGLPAQARIGGGRAPPVAHQQERQDDRAKRNGIGRIDPADIDRSHHQPGQRGANHAGDLPDQGVQADGVGQVFTRHQIGHQRLARRIVERGCGRAGRGQQVDGRDAGFAAQTQISQDAGKDRRGSLRHDEQTPAVEHVGQHAADEGKKDDGDHAHQAQDAQAQRRPAECEVAPEQVQGVRAALQQLVDMPVDGGDLHL